MREKKEETMTIKTSINWSADAGKRVKQARMAKHWEQGQLCEKARIPGRNVLAAIENGSRPPKAERLEEIAKALGVDADWLVHGDPEPEVIDVQATEIIEAPTTAKPEDVLFPGSTVGERLKYARTQAGLSAALVGGVLGISDVSIRNNEEGRTRIPYSRLEACAREYGCKVENLATVDECKEMRAYEANNAKMLQCVKKAGDAHKANREKAKQEKAKAARKLSKAPKGLIPVEAAKPVTEKTARKAETVERLYVQPVQPQPAKAPVIAAAPTEEHETLTFSTENVGKSFKAYRVGSRLSCEEMASRARLSVERYIRCEEGTERVTPLEFILLCHASRLNPDRMMAEAMTCRWVTFYSDKPVEVYAVLGLCVDHNFEYENHVGSGKVIAYCDPDYFEGLLRNLGIQGLHY